MVSIKARRFYDVVTGKSSRRDRLVPEESVGQFVEKYLENGAKVVLWGSRKETVEKAVGELRQNYGESEVSGMYPNLTDAAEVEAANR